MESSTKPILCQTEDDHWNLLERICDMEPRDRQALWAMDYSNMTRLSMLGLHQDAKALMDSAGLSHAEAHMVVVFANFLLHSKQ